MCVCVCLMNGVFFRFFSLYILRKIMTYVLYYMVARMFYGIFEKKNSSEIEMFFF